MASATLTFSVRADMISEHGMGTAVSSLTKVMNQELSGSATVDIPTMERHLTQGCAESILWSTQD